MPATDYGSAKRTGPPGTPLMPAPPAGETYTVHPRSAQPAGAMPLASGPPKEYFITPKPEAGEEGVRLLNNLRQPAGACQHFIGPGIEIVRTRPRRGVDALTLAAGHAVPSGAVLVRMDSKRGEFLVRESELPSSPFWIEENRRLCLQTEMPCLYYSGINAIHLQNGSARVPIALQVLGGADKPLQNTTIKLFAGMFNYLSATTDAHGEASIDVPVNALGLIDMILLEPETMHWPRLIREPQFKPGVKNLMRVQSFAEFDPLFYTRGALSWGVQKLLAGCGDGLDGTGCKIGIIDTGCDASHALLQHVVNGTDLSPGDAGENWRDDQHGHGTHVCGVIGANGMIEGSRQRGMAPGADIHIYKIFPGNDTFTLGSAIEAAIADGMDIINISLSAPPSRDIAKQIAHAHGAGIACVIAAGNCGSNVLFPACLNTALGISAVGHHETTPLDSLSASTMSKTLGAMGGYFSPAFSCFGNAIDFTSPGVGIVSTYPGQGLKPLDGTSMAAPHVAGLAALYLAHHHDLRHLPRGSERLEQLGKLLCRHTFALPFGPDRVGHGMPLAPQSTTLAAQMQACMPAAGVARWMM